MESLNFPRSLRRVQPTRCPRSLESREKDEQDEQPGRILHHRGTEGADGIMSSAAAIDDREFLRAFRGGFTSALRWHQLDELWTNLRQSGDQEWFLYAVGEAPPKVPASAAQVQSFITEIDKLLRQEHKEDYCGIVYADDLEQPAFVKIYDPNNLGVSCGYSENPPLPGWIMSKLPPCDLSSTQVLPGGRRRWWRRLFGG